MKPGIPWSVKGIDPEVREAAKHAARRSGMTLGEWLNAMILEQDTQDPSAAAGDEPPPPLAARPAARDETAVSLEDIAQQLARLAERDRESASIEAYEPPPRHHDSEMLDRILARVDSNEQQTVAAFSSVSDRLSVLGRQLAMTARVKPPERPEDVPGFPALETALRNVVEHIEVSEKRTRETLKTVQDRLADMAERAASSNTAELVRSAPAFSDLESRLGEFAERLGRSEGAMQATLSDLVRQELAHLAERIETVRETSETLAGRTHSAAVQAARQELHDIETRILGLLNDAQNTLSGSTQAAAGLDRLRQEIAGLDTRIDDVKRASASDGDVAALRVAFEQLSTRVAQGPDLRPLSDMDRRLDEIARKLEQDHAATLKDPRLGALENRMVQLDTRLDEAIRAQGDGGALRALEQQVGAVNERLGQAERQLGHIETIERAVSQLFDGLEQSRKLAQQAAEDAATRMADRILQAQQPAAGPSPELIAMSDGLKAVRESTAESDRRNQETLAAVHDTLEQIVTKLAELETAAAGHQLAVAMAKQQVQQPEPQQAWAPPPFEPLAAPEAQPVAAARQAALTPAAPANPFAELELLQPPARREPALPPQLEVPPAQGGDDFIAAARRAAQAAATRGPTSANLRAETKLKQKSGFSFRLPFLKDREAPQPLAAAGQHAPLGAPATANHGKRQRLLLAGIILLAAVSALTFNMLSRSGAPIETPAKVESLAPPSQGSKSGMIAPSPKPPAAVAAEPHAGLPSPDDIAERIPVPADDTFVTGSLPARKTDTTLTAIVAEPGSAFDRPDMPPAEIGPRPLREAAVRGDATAQFVIASKYLDGDAVGQDFTKAAYWYQQAASRGLAPAQYRIATLFERGKGVPQDVATALVWYERAAANGNVKAMHNAAVIAAGNQAGTPNYDRAFKWFQAAARHGLKDSQFNLAVLHERGLGTKASPHEALFWYTLAARQDDADAKKRGDALAKTLPPSTVEAAAGKATEWKPEPSVDDANVVSVTENGWKEPAAAEAPQGMFGAEAGAVVR